jgi:hypothetical protein
MTEWANLLRTRAWYRVFQVAQAVANNASLTEVRQRLVDAIDAIDKVEKEEHGG